MKKVLSFLIAASLSFSSLSAFAMPSGMKDVEDSGKSTEVAISVGQYSNKQFPYTVSFSSGSGETEYYTIRAKCGDREYPAEDIILAPGSSMSKDFVMDNVPQGAVKLSVDVIKNDGTSAANYSNEESIMSPANISYLEPYTRRVGMSGSYSWNQLNRYAYYEKYGSGRLEFSWKNGEKKKGVYTIAQKDNAEKLHEANYDIIALAAYNNDLYCENKGVRYGPDTKENFDGFAAYMNAIREAYPFIKYFEVWNEPNGSTFWSQGKNETDYTYLAEVSRAELKKHDENAKTLIGVVANGDTAFVKKTLDEGLWPNMDIVANHPYIRPAKVDEAYHRVLSGMSNLITRYGGWKEHYITEVGWPTHTAGVSREQAAIELAKQVIVADYYDIMQNQYYMIGDSIYDGAYNPANSEHNFGVIMTSANGKPNGPLAYKPSVYSIKGMLDETNGSILAGQLPFENEDIQAYMYMRDGGITCAIWTKGEATKLTFEGEALTGVDMNGNEIGVGSTFDIVEAPTYLRGLDKYWLVKALPKNIENMLDSHMNGPFDESLDNKGFTKAKEILYSDIDAAKALLAEGEYPTEEHALELLEKHYALTDEILDMYERGELEISIPQLNGLLFVNYWTGNLWDAVYMMSVNPESLSDYQIKSTGAIKDTQTKMNEKSGEHTLSYADAILTYAKNFNERACGINSLAGTNPFKAGAVKGWDALACQLARTAEKMAEKEPVADDNILLQLPSSECAVELSTKSTINPSVYNNRKTQPLSGHVELVSPKGEVLSISRELTLGAGESTTVPLDVILLAIEEGNYQIRFVENEKVIVSRNAHLKGKSIYNVKLENQTTVFDGVNSIKVNVEHLKDANFEGKIELKPLCDWELDSNEKDFSISPIETKVLEWQVTKKESAKFHFYPFEITIRDKDGNVNYNSIQLLNFNIINKAKANISVTDFDGNIDDWYDAYPVYGIIPDNPCESSQWQGGDFYNRMMTKWDENYFYLMFDVVDQYHANLQAAASIWNGDSIQVAFDTLNNGGRPYGDDDYEYGFAFTEELGNMSYAWHAPVVGEKSSDWVSIARDKNFGMTRYLIKIPKSELAPMNLAEGNIISLNAAFNDSDLSTREKFSQFTSGIADTKWPEQYWDFKMVTDTGAVNMSNECAIPSSFDNSRADGAVDVKFTDIDGHWAKDMIVSFARKGYVSGVDELHFEPDRRVTRAEFVTMLCNISGIEVNAVEENPYDDVEASAWYAPFIAAAKAQGFIPTEIADGSFSPLSDITREDAAAILNEWYSPKKNSAYKPLVYFGDSADISRYAVEAFQNLYNNEIIFGDDNNMLRPKSTLTRAEAAAMLGRCL